MSLPPRERGLKFASFRLRWGAYTVAPSAGAWIEMFLRDLCAAFHAVAPSAGAWIEIIRMLSVPSTL